MTGLGDLARASSADGADESIYDNYADMLYRAWRGVPSMWEDEIAVPEFSQPGQTYPMPQTVPLDSVPTTPPHMPRVPPYRLGVPSAPVEQVRRALPLDTLLMTYLAGPR